jgi:hypothetical protein
MPSLGRFLTRDTWGGDANSPMSFNRWGYVEGNPVNYTDPSGRFAVTGDFLSEYDVIIDKDWPASHRSELTSALRDVSIKMKSAYLGWVSGPYLDKDPCNALLKFYNLKRKTASDFFKMVYNTSPGNELWFEWDTDCEDCKPVECKNSEYARNHEDECTPGGGFTHSSHWIEFASLSEPGGNRTSEMAFVNARNNIVHELGHAFANRLANDSTGPLDILESPYLLSLRDEEGFHLSPESASRTWRQHPGNTSPSEIFADMFLGWTYNEWADDEYGEKRALFMDSNMPYWIFVAIGD